VIALPRPPREQFEARNLEEIKAYVEERTKELNDLIAEAEGHIEKLSKNATIKGRERRQWYLGVLKGLQFSKALLQAVGVQ